ncbi:LppP/LprE family lipoprotein [Microbacterium sp. A82]|uniref:LppP/LprE family lipoprotein n=1 Tax=Microbacterium sp. A82 TaxID=3450452 RepID=UPI003F2F0D22
MPLISPASRLLALVAVGVFSLSLSACAAPPATEEKLPAAESAAATPEPTAEPTPTAEDINGRWCPTAESPATEPCVTIALPNATRDDGFVIDIAQHGSPAETEDGGFSFSTVDAPFGTYYPAGTEIAGGTPDYYPGTDLPDADRVWNGQSGTMLVRVATPEITAATCADVTAGEALAAWGGELAAAPNGTWDLKDEMGWADETYDACATLSWIVVPLTGCCLGGYPYEVMLFHKGEFVQTATEEVYGRAPEITRISEDEIEIIRSWVPDGGSGAGPYESAASTFTWDEGTEAVVREGDLPPYSF